MRPLILFVSLFIASLAIVDKDWSFLQMCKHYEGSLEDGGADRGQICTFSHPVATKSREHAEEYCRENIPFHITLANSDSKRTVCQAESTLICLSGWVQMFGRCYQILKKLKTHSDAKAYCEGLKDNDKRHLNASIAFLHRPSLIARWKEYFTRTNRIWLEASAVYTEDLIVNKGPNMLLAYDGYRYSVPNDYLLRVPETEKAMVLCEYTPPMTVAESNYLMRRYNEIYYPSLSTPEGAYARSASSRYRDDEDKLADSKYCEKVLSPFLKAVGAQSAIPTETFKKALYKTWNDTIIRTSVYSRDALAGNRNHRDCAVSKAKDYGMDFPIDDGSRKTLFSTVIKAGSSVWRPGRPLEKCDAGYWSTAFATSRRKDNDNGLEDMSDARRAPIYCQTRFETRTYGGCPKDYTEYKRSDGQKWCHRFYPILVTMAEAEKRCAQDDAYVGGWSDQEEMRLIDKLATDSKAQFGTDKNIWLGARRREECNKPGVDANGIKIEGYDRDPSSPCSRLRVFEWINGVANNPPDFLNNWIQDIEPNYVNDGEKCVVLLKGTVHNWGAPLVGDHKVNDVRCTDPVTNYVLCGREAPIVITEPINNLTH